MPVSSLMDGFQLDLKCLQMSLFCLLQIQDSQDWLLERDRGSVTVTQGKNRISVRNLPRSSLLLTILFLGQIHNSVTRRTNGNRRLLGSDFTTTSLFQLFNFCFKCRNFPKISSLEEASIVDVNSMRVLTHG